jgi:hypothetical protein
MYLVRRNQLAGRSLVPAVLISLALPLAPAKAERMPDALSFFEGRTELLSLVKVVMKTPYRSQTLGRGQILKDGSLSLVQQVHDQGKPTSHRRWLIRQVSPGQFTGTMSDAIGPVQIQQIGGKFLFRFKMKGKLAIEQWITPLPGGKSAKSKVTVRKLGMRVATSEGTIRKL